MVLVLALLFVITIIGMKFRSKNAIPSALDREATLSICGIFTIVIFLSHFFGYIDTSNLNFFDKSAFIFTSRLGQLVVVPFLFYSGFGVFENYKAKKDSYLKKYLKNRVLKVYVSFFIALFFFVCLSFVLKSEYTLPDYLLSFLGIRSIGNSNWYVVVILLLYLTSFFSFQLSNYDNLYFACFLQFLGSLFLILLFQKLDTPTYWWNTIVAYSLGTVFSLFKEKIVSMLSKSRAIPFLFFGLSSIGFVFFYYLAPKIFGSNDIFYALTVITFVLSIVYFTSIFQIKNRILLFLGKHAFWIYILQRLPMIALKRVSILSGNRYVYFVLCLIITIGFAFICRMLFEKTWKFLVKEKGQTSESNNVSIGIVISYISLGVSIVGGIFITPKILNALGDGQYGLYSFATSITSWLTVISGALSASYIRFASKEQKERNTSGRINTIYFKLFLGIGVLVFSVLLTAIAIAYFSGFKLPQYSDQENNLILLLLFISGLNVFINLVFSVFKHFCSLKKQFIFSRSLALVVSILTYALEIVFAVLTKSVLAVAIVTLVLGVFSSFVTMLYCLKKQDMPFEKAGIRENSPLLRAIIVFSSFIILNTIVDRINNDVDKTILGIMVNAESVTTYTLSKTFNAYLLTLSTSISSTFVPKIHELVEADNKKELNRLFLKVATSQLIILCLVVGGFISCGKQFVSLWLGESRIAVFYHAIPFMLLDVVALSCNFCIEVQRAKNKHKFRAVLYIILASVNVGISVLMVYLLPKEFAIWGVTIGTVFSVTMGNWIILNIYNKKVIGLPIGHYFLIVLRFAAYMGAGIGAAYLMMFLLRSIELSNVIGLLIFGLVFAIVYLGSLFLFERKTMLGLLQRFIKLGKKTEH